ncbi:MAG TPA: type II toxin-antitoxin system Phd/YefM family antitoxin [Thermoanaerobaculia bacterium]|nr:type II toxin-antitoxin system Phd/YefM family antitoxin [Thermoanaerobaculia bacterium]
MAEVILNLYDAKTRLSQLVERAARGEEIIIAKAGKPLAKLVPLAARREPRKPGGWEGKVRIAEDFDDPLPDELQGPFEGPG